MRETVYALGVTLSIVIITYKEEANLARTLESVMPLVRDGKGEIIVVDSGSTVRGFWIRRKNHFLGRWIKHGSFWPDPKLRLFRRGEASFEERAVHETVQVKGATRRLLTGALVHHSYPTLSDYIDHMNRYSS